MNLKESHMKPIKFRKREIAKYEATISYIREELKDDRHIAACLGSAGLTFRDDIRRFVRYALQVEAFDISGEILRYNESIGWPLW